MKKPTRYLTAFLFPAFLALMLLGTLLPKEEFSRQEKRYLAEFPAPSLSDVTSGKWGEELERWLADHIPLRSFFVGLDAYKDLALGFPSEIRRIDGRLLEAPVTDTDSDRRLAAIRSFAEACEAPVTLSIVPSAGWAAGARDYRDGEILAAIASRMDGRVDYLDMTGVFSGRPELYYRTDHHWTGEGAYEAYRVIADRFGKPARTEFTRELLPGCFQGSTYSRSALWLTPAEDLELWHGSGDITMTAGDDTPHGVFFRERLEEADKYTVFLDGNHPLVRLQNPHGEGKLLVVRDSYSNCLGPFLAESWEEVLLVDLRYYRRPVSELVSGEQPDNILILYSIGNFLTDTNLVLLR